MMRTILHSPTTFQLEPMKKDNEQNYWKYEFFLLNKEI